MFKTVAEVKSNDKMINGIDQLDHQAPSHDELSAINRNVRRVFDVAEARVQLLGIGDKISIKELTQYVAKELSVSQARIAPFISMFTRSSKLCIVQHGRLGGVYREAPPPKPRASRCSTCGRKIRALAEGNDPRPSSKAI